MSRLKLVSLVHVVFTASGIQALPRSEADPVNQLVQCDHREHYLSPYDPNVTVSDIGYTVNGKDLVNCGPPHLASHWPNVTAVDGQPVSINCPLDTRNSCLVDLVEWYFSPTTPGAASARTLLRDAAVKFDPLMIYFPKFSLAEQSGWYTCVVGNSEGRNEAFTFVGRGDRDRGRGRGGRRPVPTVASSNRVHPSPTVSRGGTWQQSGRIQEERTVVEEKFPVYSRFRGQRGFQPRSFQVATTATTLRPTRPPPPPPSLGSPPPTHSRPVVSETYTIADPHEADPVAVIKQHMRYIYDKIDSMESAVNNLERRIGRLERS